MLPLEVERPAVLPAVPESPEGQDVFPHPGARRRPGKPEPPLDVAFDLAAKAQEKPAPRKLLEVPGLVGEDGRAPGKGQAEGADPDLTSG